jgi:nucleotide-binding universal stress UspA family protein
MRTHTSKRVAGTLALLLALTACGGDPIDSAANCTELLDVASEILESEEPDEAQLEQIAEKARALAGDAQARGADTEAFMCSAIAESAEGSGVEQVFDSVGDQMDSDS